MPEGGSDVAKQHWILLRGLSRECRHWGGFAELLAEALPGSDVHCYDLPGNGTHFEQESPLSIEGIVDQLRGEVDSRDGVYLMGLSMGGMVACDWQKRYPEEVAGMVLINSSLAELNPIWQRLRSGCWLSVLNAFFSGVERREELIYRLTCNLEEDRELALWLWQQYQCDCPVRRLNFLRQLLAAARYRHHNLPFSGLLPVLVLSAQQDKLVSPQCSRKLASALGAQLCIHPSAGHDLPHDDPTWVIHAISNWMAEFNREELKTALIKHAVR